MVEVRIIYDIAISHTAFIFDGRQFLMDEGKQFDLLKEGEKNSSLGSSFFNEHFEAILDATEDAIYTKTLDGYITSWNRAAEKFYGYSKQEIIGQHVFILVPQEHREQLKELIYEVSQGRRIEKFETFRFSKDGRLLNVSVTISPIRDESEIIIGASVLVRDLTAIKNVERIILEKELEVEKGERWFKTLIENSSDAIGLVDIDGTIKYLSSTTERVLGYKPNELLNTNGFKLIHPEDIGIAQAAIESIINGPEKIKMFDVRVKNKNLGYRWVECVVKNLLNDDMIMAIVTNFRDVHDRTIAEEQRRLAQSKMEYTYLHDPLTDLPNRAYFNEKLIQGIATAKKNQSMLSVILIDLDRFKFINESLGHALGDRLIQEVSLRLRSVLEDGEILARLGGDEFGIILSEVEREDVPGKISQRILDSLKHPFLLDFHELYVTPSIGISLYPEDANDASMLMRNADAALYRAKEQGRNNFQYYLPAMNAKSFERLSLENTLRKALFHDEFVVYYQPLIEVSTGRITQVEALIRWNHPDLGLTFPEDFIGLAETTGLIEPIGEWVLRTSMEEVKKWHRNGFPDLRVSVNVSPRQFKQRHLVRMIHRILEETGFPPDKLELELTESAVIENSQAVSNILSELKRDGIKFAMDDFNAGQAPLRHVKTLPIDVLKIDRWGIKNIPMKEKDTAIANSIINLAHSLNMTAVAEGVDKPEQLEFLKQQKCDFVQGFLFSPPVPADKITELLEKNRNFPISL